MGVIKRALKRTSRKLLAKIIPPAQSHQLVLNSPFEASGELALSSGAAAHLTKRKLASLQRKYRKSNSKDTAVAEALLLAVKNHLPPLQFHHIHGPHAQLSQSKRVARRTQSFCQALVFSNRVILPNERIYIKVLEISKCWSGTIRFGFTAVDPATLACRMPKHACPDMTNAGHTWARALADEVVRRNSVIHFSYNKHGVIHYGINNQDCGIFHAKVGTKQNLWFIVDIYGLTAAVELIDPRVNNASSEINFSRIDDELSLGNRSATMYKSTSAMDELFGRYGGGSSSGSANRLRKKQSRKQARQLALNQGNWPLENFPEANFRSLQFTNQQHPGLGAMQLPNLNSVTLPSVQQNIYSPMPNQVDGAGLRERARNETHDYHQIVSNTYSNGLYQPIRSEHSLATSVSMANLSHQSANVAATPSVSNCNSNNSASDRSNQQLINQVAISQRFENLHLNDESPRQQVSTSKSTKSSTNRADSQLPIAATRRKQQQLDSTQTNLKRTPEVGRDQHDRLSSDRIVSGKSNTSLSPSTSATTRPHAASSDGYGSVKPKARHSIKSQRSTSARDNNQNNPPGKDCPICFERPINCVLYQCGHMCTCYECGVKQWRTQSRTCPICRSVIKDVIKTYLS